MVFIMPLEELSFFIHQNLKADAVQENLRPYLAFPFSKPFNELLFQFIDQKGIRDATIYQKACIDRRLFSKIRSHKEYHPSFKTITLLSLALELNTKDYEKLLQSAAYSLPKNKIEYLVIRYCFDHKIYELSQVNQFLLDTCQLSLDDLK